MGGSESKAHYRYRSDKDRRCRHVDPSAQQCQHKRTSSLDNRRSLKGKNDQAAPLIISPPLRPTLQGSILNHTFPMQRSQSENHVGTHDGASGHLHPFVQNSQDYPKGAYDYRRDMQRVDEENRPVLEGLCPDKMYVSTNDLRICNAQRLPPPLRCKTAQAYFRPVAAPRSSHAKKTTLDPLFL